jgi:hypothetical protein
MKIHECRDRINKGVHPLVRKRIQLGYTVFKDKTFNL